MTQIQKSRRLRYKKLRYEHLENRLLLAADIGLYQNPLDSVDVNNDSYISPLDALHIINELNGSVLESDKISAFYDTSGDGILAPVDALTVINDLNHPELSDDLFSDKIEIAADYLEANHDLIDQQLIPISDQIIGLHEKFQTVADTIRDHLDLFLEFSIENTPALNTQLEKLEVAYHASQELFYQEFLGLNHEFDVVQQELDPDFDPSMTETDSGFEFDPSVEYSDEVFEEIVEELDELNDEYEIPDYSTAYEGYDNYLDAYDPSTTELNDYVLEQVTPDDYEQWVLDGGDFQEMLDDLDEDVFVGEVDIEDYVTNTFGDPTVAVNYVQNLIDHGFVGELFYGDLNAIGGESTGSGIELSDGSMLEIDLRDDPLLVTLAQELDGQNVLVDGHITIVTGVEIPERSVLNVLALVSEPTIRDVSSSLTIISDPFVEQTALMLNELADRVRDA
ncbi:MAG: hypothetical protein CMP22_03305 [Rickettsiales bacterium]|nr:hypothetical protein [Rickettsiales bacterium]|tara:strand:+ start:7815 stop:9167 length:1353 start_codon:yes stop_codon:yes gene_type:complete